MSQSPPCVVAVAWPWQGPFLSPKTTYASGHFLRYHNVEKPLKTFENLPTPSKIIQPLRQSIFSYESWLISILWPGVWANIRWDGHSWPYVALYGHNILKF